jgi:hypothetical protein
MGLIGDVGQVEACFCLLGDMGLVEAHFGLFEDSVNLSAR